MKSIFCEKQNDKKLIKMLPQYNCISFDVFDTLIKRNIKKPQDLYDLIGHTVESKYGIEGFGSIRYESEMTLYALHKNVTLDLIYEEIQKKLQTVDCNLLKNLEIEFELSYCQSNFYIQEIYRESKRLGKRIIAVSDMYLPQYVIEHILVKCGYDLHSVYVSCEYGASKRNGKLFEIVLEKENLQAHEVLHIGDSLYSDFYGAKKCGIAAYKIERELKVFHTKRFSAKLKQPAIYNIHECIINNNLKNMGSFYKKFGFSILGPALYSFIRWIEKECMQNDVKTVFFFSRDGYIMKKVFDTVATKRINSRYLYVSRRALRVPYNASHFKMSDIIDLLPGTKQIKVETIFEYLDLDIEKYNFLLDEFEINGNSVVHHHDLTGKYYRILERLLPDYVSKAQKELSNALGYLKQEHVNGKIAVVDIGWHNSMQRCMEAILNENGISTEVYGLYFGIQSDGFNVKHSKGYIEEPGGSKFVDSAASFIGLIESLFLEQQGTVLKYKKIGNDFVPVRDEYEYEEASAEFSAYSDIHLGVLEYVNKICTLRGNKALMLNGHDAYLPLWSFGVCPYMADVDRFAGFRYFSEGTYYLADYKSCLYYLAHIKELKTDAYNARWKTGFLKKLFKMNIPYYSLYQILKKR